MPRGVRRTTTMKESQSQQQKKRAYEKTAAGHVVYFHKSRTTGSEVAVMRAPEEFGRNIAWLALCLTHHQFAPFDTRIQATTYGNRSAEWCSVCYQVAKKDKTVDLRNEKEKQSA